MELTYLGHAGWYIVTPDFTLLCDPWKGSNPKFFNSWYVFPKNDGLPWKKYMEADYLYISHLHEDHFDINLLKEIPKNITIISPSFKFYEHRKTLEELGFTNFMDGSEGITIGGTFMKTFTTETIDRMVEDSMLFIDDGVNTFLDRNDCDFIDDHFDWFKDNTNGIDFYTGQFSGACWYPNCYENYDKEEMEKISIKFRKKSIDNFIKIGETLKVKKFIPSAGPPIFLDPELEEFIDFGDPSHRFPDAWQAEFEKENVYCVKPGYSFNYENLYSQKFPIMSKQEYLEYYRCSMEKTKNKHYIINLKKEFINFIKPIVETHSTWLKKYITIPIYIKTKLNGIYKISFYTKTNNYEGPSVSKVGKVNEIDDFYCVTIPDDIFSELVLSKETDWEKAFLSCRCKFKRKPDLFNSWILGFFRNLDVDRLRIIKNNLNHKDNLEFFQFGDKHIQKFCPHMKYDLEQNSIIDTKKGVITCQGHCWEWDLKTGKGLNTNKDLKIYETDNRR